jgi:hypothetical protein
MLTLSVAIFIHSSKLASKGMTRDPGVTAVPVMSGMSSWSGEGVWGLSWPAASDTRRRPGVAVAVAVVVEARIESRWACCWAWRRAAFSWRSSLSGTLRATG